MRFIKLFKSLFWIKLLFGLITIFSIPSCESEESKYYWKVREEFSKYAVSDIKENWKSYIAYALEVKIQEEKKEAELAQQGWRRIDPNYSAKEKSKEDSPKWRFWQEIIKAPEKYVTKTKNGDIFVEYEISTYQQGWLYHSAMVKILFVKDEWFGFFRIFFIHTPEKHGWREVDYGFSWPSIWPSTKKIKK